MASSAAPQQVPQPSRSSFGGFTGGNGALALDKGRLNARRSTPDSEVVASSDDELDKHALEPSATSAAAAAAATAPKPVRRSSWLSDVQTLPQRRGSFAGAGPLSPANAHPTTPPAEAPSWAGAAAPGLGLSLIHI
ncbi:MAG: hypothetical protein M1832_001345 [Thelocarpon impressellum]|nr:MAG: hypothetical protein M1832_001345 [Thelocarpon impressellum]